jgi:hypothetical protein
MIKKILLLQLFIYLSTALIAQDKTFSYIMDIDNPDQIKLIADSLKKPLLISGNKIYAIGSKCINHLLDGTVNDRDDDGDVNDRDKDGGINGRKKGGDVSDRKRKGKSNKRNKDGDANDRDSDGGTNNRDKDGSIGTGPRCEINTKGKLILYTRQKINKKKAQIYYKGNYFNYKSFKIIQL